MELHEYLRRDHVVVVRLQQRTSAGSWVTVASAEGQDAEGAAATTGTYAVSGAVRACATGGLRGHEQATVCTS